MTRALRPKATLRALLRLRRRGVAAVEFALAAPILLLLVLAAVDFGWGFYDGLQVQGAASAGAQYASMHAWDSGAITTAVETATPLGTLVGLGRDPTTNLQTPIQVCACPTASSGLNISATLPDFTTGTASCTQGSYWGSHTTDCNGGTWGLYASVNTQYAYFPMLPYPWTPSPLPLTAQAYRRLQ